MAVAGALSRVAAATVALLVAAQPAMVEGSSLYLAEKCRGGFCRDPKFPILDFDAVKGECVCRAHPCWDNNGVDHFCEGRKFPFLHFTYDANRTLTCSCSSVPQYDSIHISKDLCPGEKCDSAATPVLDYNPHRHKCLCRAHPCWNEHGKKHSCTNDKYPILHYQEDYTRDGRPLPKCECVSLFQKPKPPAKGLRGATVPANRQKAGRPVEDTGVCSFSKFAPPSQRTQRALRSS